MGLGCQGIGNACKLNLRFGAGDAVGGPVCDCIAAVAAAVVAAVVVVVVTAAAVCGGVGAGDTASVVDGFSGFLNNFNIVNINVASERAINL